MNWKLFVKTCLMESYVKVCSKQFTVTMSRPTLQTPTTTSRVFVPYWNPEQYLVDLKKNGTDTDQLERLHKQHPPPNDYPLFHKKELNIDMRPLATLYKKYSKPCVKPPLEERIKALHEAGYPEDILLDVMKKDAKRLASEAKMSEFIFTIFGEVNDKKAASTKKRTIQQILKIKKRLFAVPEPTEEEIPVEDDSVYEDDEL